MRLAMVTGSAHDSNAVQSLRMVKLMKCVILAGGLGTRLSEETQLRPKPMVYIGQQPILWHIMKTYSAHGINDFVICLGYKGYMIKEYFANYCLHSSDVTFDLTTGEMQIQERNVEPWRVTLVDTGEKTMTGGRLLEVAKYIDDDFCMTYGDGVADVDVSETIKFHRNAGKLATVTAVQPPGRFGGLQLDGNQVESFVEKPVGEGGWINGGFFVLSPQILNYIEGPSTVFEQEPLRELARDGELAARKHNGFWQPMDTLREKHLLERLWNTGNAPWNVWDQQKVIRRIGPAVLHRAA